MSFRLFAAAEPDETAYMGERVLMGVRGLGFGERRSVTGCVVVLAALTLGIGSASCGGPLPGADTPVQSQNTDPAASTDAAAPTSAGPEFHTITVTSCVKDRDGCGKAPANASGGYRFAFGGGIGTLRSREQATADLYREIRDRTVSGARLAANEHVLKTPAEEAGTIVAVVAPAAPNASDLAANDELVEAARQLMLAVDTAGKVTVDVSHGRAGCKISLTPDGSDGSARRCLIREASRGGEREQDEAPRGHEQKPGKT